MRAIHALNIFDHAEGSISIDWVDIHLNLLSVYVWWSLLSMRPTSRCLGFTAASPGWKFVWLVEFQMRTSSRSGLFFYTSWTTLKLATKSMLFKYTQQKWLVRDSYGVSGLELNSRTMNYNNIWRHASFSTRHDLVLVLVSDLCMTLYTVILKPLHDSPWLAGYPRGRLHAAQVPRWRVRVGSLILWVPNANQLRQVEYIPAHQHWNWW